MRKSSDGEQRRWQIVYGDPVPPDEAAPLIARQVAERYRRFANARLFKARVVWWSMGAIILVAGICWGYGPFVAWCAQHFSPKATYVYEVGEAGDMWLGPVWAGLKWAALLVAAGIGMIVTGFRLRP